MLLFSIVLREVKADYQSLKTELYERQQSPLVVARTFCLERLIVRLDFAFQRNQKQPRWHQSIFPREMFCIAAVTRLFWFSSAIGISVVRCLHILLNWVTKSRLFSILYRKSRLSRGQDGYLRATRKRRFVVARKYPSWALESLPWLPFKRNRKQPR